MKNRLLAISIVTMACTLCACGTQGAGTSAFTEGSTEQAVMTEERTEQREFTEKFASVYDAYQKLLGPDAEELLEDAGCEDAAYPWSDAPVETIETIYEVVQ